jgi:uncharacterized membrane protein
MRRIAIAFFALTGALVALYLTLFRLGLMSGPYCTSGSACDVIQASPWSKVLGIPVPTLGLVAYSAILVLAVAGTRPRGTQSVGIHRALALLGVVALLFAGYNTAIELFVIHAFCVWCAVCAGAAAGIFLLTLPEWRGPHSQRRRPVPA